MEIRHYVRGLLSRAWIVVLVTLLAGGAAGGIRRRAAVTEP